MKVNFETRTIEMTKAEANRAANPNSETFMKLTNPYLANPGIIFYSKDKTRVLPADTTYEFWGVRA